jgi:hypothetical protein
MLIKNFVREHEVNKYRNPKAYEAWKEFIKDLKARMTLDFNVEEEEEAKEEVEVIYEEE